MGFKKSIYLKLPIVLLILAIILFIIGYSAIDRWNEVSKSEGRRALTAARIINILLDVEEFQQIMLSGETNEYYYEFKSFLNEMIIETEAMYIYIMSRGDGNNYVYFMEGDHIFVSNIEPLLKLWDLEPIDYHHPQIGSSLHTGNDAITDVYNIEDFGLMVTGISVIINNDGRSVGVIGVDISMSDTRNKIISDAIIQFAITFFIIGIFTVFVLNNYEKTIKRYMLSNIDLNELKKILGGQTDEV